MTKLENVTFSMDEAKVCQMAVELAIIIEKAHKSGKIHGNINPDNIFVDEAGNFILEGWDDAEISISSRKDNYQAPEVYQGCLYTETADLYALGLILYQMMNENRLPFYPLAAENMTLSDKEYALRRRMAGEVFPAPKNASAELGKVILKACAYKQEERYYSAKEFLNEFVLDSVLNEIIGDADVIEIIERDNLPEKKKPRFRIKRVATCAAWALVGALAAWGLMTIFSNKEKGENENVSNQNSNTSENNTSNTIENQELNDSDKEYEEFYIDGGEILVRKYPEEDGGSLQIRYDEKYNVLNRIRFNGDNSIAYEYYGDDDVCEYVREMEYYDGKMLSSSSYEQYYKECGFEPWVSHQYSDGSAAHYRYGILLSSQPDFEYEISEYLMGIEYIYDDNYSILRTRVTCYYMGDNSVWQIQYDEEGRIDYMIHNIYDSNEEVISSSTHVYTESGTLSRIETIIKRKYRIVTKYNADGTISDWIESFLNDSGNVTKANRYIGIFEKE